MSIFEKAIAAIGVYLIVAVIMIVLVGKKRKDPVAGKALWKKFFVYLALIGILMTAIHFGFVIIPLALIITIGFGELLFVASKAQPQPKLLVVLFSLVVYLFFAFGFGCWRWIMNPTCSRCFPASWSSTASRNCSDSCSAK